MDFLQTQFARCGWDVGGLPPFLFLGRGRPWWLPVEPKYSQGKSGFVGALMAVPAYCARTPRTATKTVSLGAAPGSPGGIPPPKASLCPLSSCSFLGWREPETARGWQSDTQRAGPTTGACPLRGPLPQSSAPQSARTCDPEGQTPARVEIEGARTLSEGPLVWHGWDGDWLAQHLGIPTPAPNISAQLVLFCVCLGPDLQPYCPGFCDCFNPTAGPEGSVIYDPMVYLQSLSAHGTLPAFGSKLWVQNY